MEWVIYERFRFAKILGCVRKTTQSGAYRGVRSFAYSLRKVYVISARATEGDII